MQHCTKQLYQQKKKNKKKTRTTHSQTSISKTQKSKAWLVMWENTNHPLTNVNLKNTEIKSLACDMRKHEPPTHKRKSQKQRNQKLGLWHEKTRTTHSQTSISKTQKSKAWLVTWERCGGVKLVMTFHTKTSWYPNHQYANNTKYNLDRFNSSQKDQQYVHRKYHKHRSLLTEIPHSVFRNNIPWTNFHWKYFSQNEETWYYLS